MAAHIWEDGDPDERASQRGAAAERARHRAPPAPQRLWRLCRDREDRQSALSERHAAGRRARAAIRRTRRWRAVGGGRAKGGGDCLPQRLIRGQGGSRRARHAWRSSASISRRKATSGTIRKSPTERPSSSSRSSAPGCSRAASSSASPACPSACRSKSSSFLKSRPSLASGRRPASTLVSHHLSMFARYLDGYAKQLAK